MNSYFLAYSWGIFILLAFIGWGALINRILFPKYLIDWGQSAAWGISFSICCGGILNFSCTISPNTILIFLILGFSYWLLDVYRNKKLIVNKISSGRIQIQIDIF